MIMTKIKLALFIIFCVILAGLFIFAKSDMSNTADDFANQSTLMNDNKGVNSKAQFDKQYNYQNSVNVAENSSSGNSNTSTFGNWSGLSNKYWGSWPIELFVLSTCGEMGSSEAAILKCNGDKGQAYSIMQLDYRYDLVPFMQQAYAKDPVAWSGFANYINLKAGDSSLKSNQGIIDAFNSCYKNYPDVYFDFLPDFFVNRYYNNDNVKSRLDAAGINLENHSIYVAGALISCNINCGEITGTQNFIKAGAKDDMSDEELLNCVYTGWRMYRKSAKWAKSKHRLALDKTGEEGLALQLLHGDVDPLTYDNTKTCSWGAGWDGPNSARLAHDGGK